MNISAGYKHVKPRISALRLRAFVKTLLHTAIFSDDFYEVVIGQVTGPLQKNPDVRRQADEISSTNPASDWGWGWGWGWGWSWDPVTPVH